MRAYADLLHRYPRLLVLVLFLIGAAGISSFQLLPRAEDPHLSGRLARIVTRYPGASPERVEALVTEKLEDELLELPEIQKLRSESRAGVSSILIELKDEISGDMPKEVWSRARDKLSDAEPGLPAEASKPELEEMEVEAFTLVVGLKWDDEDDPPDYNSLRRYAEMLEDRLRAVPGTDEVEVYGAPAEELRVEVDHAALASLGRSAGDLAAQIRLSDAKVPAGRLRGPDNDVLIEVEGELDTVERLRSLPIRQGPDGRVVRVGDIATVERTVAEPPDQLALVAGRPAVVVASRMGVEERIDLWRASSQKALDEFQAKLPGGIALDVVFDQSRYTTARLNELMLNLTLGVALVIAVMLFVMGWRSALLVGAALPLTTLMVFAGMKFWGIPIHQMSVTGLIIALGLLIDNAIVMVDEVRHRLGEGRGIGAAIQASFAHLAVPLLSSTVTTVLAFVPIAIMPGGAGEFVGAIALSVILALISSLFLSLFVLPSLAAFLGLEPSSPAGVRAAWYQEGISQPHVERLYASSLTWVFRRPWAGLALALVLPLIGMVGAAGLDEQFFPPSDRDQFRIDLRLREDAPLAETLATVHGARRLLLDHPQVTRVDWLVGRAAPKFYYNMTGGEEGAAYFAQGQVQLASPEGSQRVINELQARFDAAFPRAQALLLQLEQGPPFDAPVEYKIYGPDLDELRRLSEQARALLAQGPVVTHTRSTLADGLPSLELRVDDDELRLAGLNNVQVARQLAQALDGALGGSLLEGTDELPVRVRLAESERGELGQIRSLDVQSGSAFLAGGDDRALVPLGVLGSLELEPERAVIVRREGRRMTVVQGFIRAGVLPSVALHDFEARLEAANFTLPPGYTASFGGEAAERDQAVGNLMASAMLLMILMAASLVLAFNSFRQASLIAFVGVLSIGLSLMALVVFDHPFGFMAIVGTMGLIGVAINDAIVVLAAIREDPAASAGDLEAVQRVVLRSTRHVVATTLTTVAGFVPLLVAGGAFWAPLATAVAGGVAGATMLALYFVPCGYLILLRLGMSCPIQAADGTSAPPESEPTPDVNDSRTLAAVR